MKIASVALIAAVFATMSLPIEMARNPSGAQVVRPIGPAEAFRSKAVDHFPLGESEVLIVTNLRPDGPGSLRAALGHKGPRLVVFEVGGVIDLAGSHLQIREPLVFVAGETAPSPGITLVRGSLIVETDHVVIRHLAVRPGDGRPNNTGPWEPDGITVVRAKNPVHDVLIQNCSATWAVDENASVSGPRDTRPSAGAEATAHAVSFRNNLIAEGLRNATHSKGPHSMGLLIHDGIREVSIEGNLFAHNNERNPRLKGGVVAAVTGNVIYNWGSAAIGVGARGNEEILDGARAVVRGNVALSGPDTSGKGQVLVRAVDPGASVEASGNLTRDAAGRDLKELDLGIEPLNGPLTWPGLVPFEGGTSPSSASATLSAVLRRAGSRPAERDAIDRRIVASVIAGSGRIIDSQNQVGGYPIRPETRRALKAPDGAAARLAWLEDFTKSLATDRDLDVSPLLNRLNLPR